MGAILFIIVFPTAYLGGKGFSAVEQYLQKRQNVTVLDISLNKIRTLLNYIDQMLKNISDYHHLF